MEVDDFNAVIEFYGSEEIQFMLHKFLTSVELFLRTTLG